MTAPETRWIRDVPSDPMMQRQWNQTAIPWCTTHDTQAKIDTVDDTYCRLGTFISGPCVISTGPPDHKWWKDVDTQVDKAEGDN